MPSCPAPSAGWRADSTPASVPARSATRRSTASSPPSTASSIRLNTAFSMGRGGALALVKLGGLLLLIGGAAAWFADRLPSWLK